MWISLSKRHPKYKDNYSHSTEPSLSALSGLIEPLTSGRGEQPWWITCPLRNALWESPPFYNKESSCSSSSLLLLRCSGKMSYFIATKLFEIGIQLPYALVVIYLRFAYLRSLLIKLDQVVSAFKLVT